MKKAAGYPGDSIEVIYDKWKNPPKTINVKPNAGDGNNTSVAAAAVGGTGTTVANPTNPADAAIRTTRPSEVVTVHVHAPEAAPAAVVNVTRGYLSSIAAWSQTMALGVVVGVLISRHVLRVMGF